nr:type IV secretion system protein [uncultured Rhodopila sp.]
MRAILLATAVLLLPIAAHAQVSTDSINEDLALAKSYLQSIQSYILEQTSGLHAAATDLQTAQIYAQELQTYIAFVQNPTLSAAMGLINQAGLGSDLPINPTQVMGLANGFGSVSSGGTLTLNGAFAALRSVNGYAQGAFGANHQYTCKATDQACQDMNARANGIAGSMGIAQAAYADVQAHAPIIQALRDDLAGETDPAKRETIQAQLQAELLYVANTETRMNAAYQQATLQQQSFQQRTLERQRSAADDLFDSTMPVTSTAAVVSASDAPAALPPLFTAQ